MEKMNLKVESDLLFWDSHIILHFVDRATRWQAATVVATKSASDLIDGLDRVWVSTFGPMKELIIDGETGLASEECAAYLDRKGITRRPRAPNQHAQFAERRGGLLKEQLNRSASQLRTEGYVIGTGSGEMTVSSLLAECVFAGNALLSYHGSSPYEAVFGRVPPMLPEATASIDETSGELSLTSRDHHRMREISLNSIIECSAQDRIRRALNTPARAPAESFDYRQGDSVDLYRHGLGEKHISGWLGPATIIDISEASHGQICVKWQGRHVNCRLQDLRPHLALLVFLSCDVGALSLGRGKALTLLRAFIEEKAIGNSRQMVTLGHPRNDNLKDIYAAAEHVARTGCGLPRIDCVRIGVGLSRLPQAPGFVYSLVLWYFPQEPDLVSCVENDNKPLNLRHAIGDDYYLEARVVQFLVADGASDWDHDQRHQQSSSSTSHPHEPELQPQSNDGPLSPIEEYDDDDADGDILEGEDGDDPVLFSGLTTANFWLRNDVGSVYVVTDDHGTHIDSMDILPQRVPPDTNVELEVSSSFLVAHADPADVEFVEIAFGHTWGPMFDDLPREAEEGETILLRVYLNSPVKKTVIERDTDDLTREELVLHRDMVITAIATELKTWHHYKCFSRRKRAGARNVIDCRWVIKWKFVQQPDGQMKRTIRARLTVRGFKDRDANNLSTYAGTSTRWSQRLVVSTSASRGWPIVSVDVEKAFLQGMTYQELSQLTGEPLRDVSFVLPTGSIAALRQLPGYSDFDSTTECLHCDKPGTGLKDAPQAFSLKLKSVTRRKCGLKQTSFDPELEILHVDGHLRLVIAIHVDDLKMTGPPETIKWFMDQLEATFGKLKCNWNSFTNCGIRHIRDPQTSTVTLDQHEYAKALKPLVHADLRKGKEDALSDESHGLYLSLLGALAYLALTRLDIIVFIAALQRYNHKPQTIHARRLNSVVRWVQRNPVSLTYLRMNPANNFVVGISDAAFKKDEDEATAMRGCVVCRLGSDCIVTDGSTEKLKGGATHILEFASRKQRHVTRSTFAAELFGACDCMDLILVVNLALHEIEMGPVPAMTARQLRDEGGLCYSTYLCIDAMSVFSAITAKVVKPPAERSLVSHVQWLRQMLDWQVLRGIVWLDTRDMVSDGLTKGKVSRVQLHALMRGFLKLSHDSKSWSSQAKSSMLDLLGQ